jgi:hypothetical protein
MVVSQRKPDGADELSHPFLLPPPRITCYAAELRRDGTHRSQEILKKAAEASAK